MTSRRREPRKPRKTRKNGPSTWPAKAVEWPMATNAGPFLPQMFPFGIGGVRQDYALKNAGEETPPPARDPDFPKTVYVFKSKYGPFSRLQYLLINSVTADNRYYVLKGLKENTQIPTFIVTVWDEKKAEIMEDGGLFGQRLYAYSPEEADQLAADCFKGMQRKKLLWLPPKYVVFYQITGRGIPVAGARFRTRVYAIVRMPAGRFKVVMADEADSEGLIFTLIKDVPSLEEAKAYAEAHAGL